MFPSLSILQHYAKFDTCTIVTLEKLFDATCFGGSIGHLARCYATFLASSNKFNFSFVV
jgi:hypothetical protein